uniref:Protein kinase domain-containing protein n=1 Tax=Oreochromis aureus TaxID=47969 RepID=A0AAZ1XK62_OREAU
TCGRSLSVRATRFILCELWDGMVPRAAEAGVLIKPISPQAKCQLLQKNTDRRKPKYELEIVKGSILGSHYKVEAFLGEGGFGIVAKCRDTMTKQAVAIKVNKSRPDILQQAKLEIFILEQLRRLDPDAANIVQWNGFFHDGERVCLKFELLDQCLWDYIRDRQNQGLPISEVRPILGQLTNALSHLGSVGIVHADLKCRNIMVVNRHESPIKVKLIDFGLACPASAVIPGDCVGTVGVPLYPGNEHYDVLKFIIETQGQPPDHVLDSGVYTEDYFTEDNYNYNQQRWTFKTDEQFKYETGYESLETRHIKLACLEELEEVMMFRRGPENGQRLFVSLIKQMPILGQLTNALSHLGSVGIVHADLKPGNIMVVNRHESPVKVRLIDFGLACPASAVIPGHRVGTVGYSAPEVMLGLPYNEAIDMWSLGLVAVELATGVPLYPGNEYYDVLKFIIETQGQPPDHVLDSGVYTEDFFIEDNYNYNQQRWTFKTDEQFQYETGYEQGPEDGQRLFVSLIKGMLALDAHQRITPSEVLRHPFFSPGLSNRFPCIDNERPYRLNLQHDIFHPGQN